MDAPNRNHRIKTPTDGTATLCTRGGIVMSVRPVLPTDGPILEALFEKVSPGDLRFRFLSGIRHVDEARIRAMIGVDFVRTFTFLAFDANGEAIATAMLAADTDGKDAEIALSVRSDMKGRGVGWTLLQHVLRYGENRGFENVRSIESRQNNETIELERDAGFEFHACEGDPADIVAVKHLIGQQR